MTGFEKNHDGGGGEQEPGKGKWWAADADADAAEDLDLDPHPHPAAAAAAVEIRVYFHGKPGVALRGVCLYTPVDVVLESMHAALTGAYGPGVAGFSFVP